MKREKHQNVALKLGKMAHFRDIHSVSAPTANFPVNLYCETFDHIRFYVACDKWNGGWSVDYTLDPSVLMRSHMTHISHFKNQTEALAFVKNNILANSEYKKS